ncbi:MAG: DUF4956 domain-containing protein [Chitinophagales bacterium]|nr:DUF4956 domain-containing protein [Chitinophagales bacterium]
METVEVSDEAVKQFAFFGIEGIGEFLLRYGINLLVTFILVRIIYYPRHRNKDFVFTFFLFNTVNFLICFLLSSTKLKIGFAFGLFAIFSILRYRTVTVPIREMGYFFLSVTIGIINALSDIDSGITLIVIANGLILLMTYLLDRQLSLEHENYKEINYERIELIHPEKREEMIEDLKRRTGLPIHRIELIKLDFLRDVARIHAFYYSRDNDSASRDVTQDDD